MLWDKGRSAVPTHTHMYVHSTYMDESGYLLGQDHVALGYNGIYSVLVCTIHFAANRWSLGKVKENYIQKGLILRMVKLVNVTKLFSRTWGRYLPCREISSNTWPSWYGSIAGRTDSLLSYKSWIYWIIVLNIHTTRQQALILLSKIIISKYTIHFAFFHNYHNW